MQVHTFCIGPLTTSAPFLSVCRSLSSCKHKPRATVAGLIVCFQVDSSSLAFSPGYELKFVFTFDLCSVLFVFVILSLCFLFLFHLLSINSLACNRSCSVISLQFLSFQSHFEIHFSFLFFFQSNSLFFVYICLNCQFMKFH